MKRIEGTIKITGKEGIKLGGDSEILVITEAGTEIDISHCVTGFVYTAFVGQVEKVELTIIRHEVKGLAKRNLITEVAEEARKTRTPSDPPGTSSGASGGSFIREAAGVLVVVVVVYCIAMIIRIWCF